MARDLTQTRVSSRVLYESRIIKLRQDIVRLADGREFTRDVVEHPGAVVIVPLLPDGRVLLVRQWRNATGGALLELPAGTLEPAESPERCAAREIQEEVGYAAGRLTPLARFYTAPGFCSEVLHLFLAEDLTPARLDGDEDEELEVEAMSLAEAAARAARGEFADAKTLIGLLLAAARKEVRP